MNDRVEYNINGITHEIGFTNDLSKEKGKEIEKKSKTVYSIQDAAINLLHKNNSGMVVTFKNGNAFLDGGISIKTPDGKMNNYLAYPVYMNNDIVYDSLNGYDEINVYDYLNLLSSNNKKLRIDFTMSFGTPWNDKIGYWLNKYSKRK